MAIPLPIADAAKRPRVFRTELPAGAYLELERRALDRGLSAYALAGAVLAAYLDGSLSETPSDPAGPESVS